MPAATVTPRLAIAWDCPNCGTVNFEEVHLDPGPVPAEVLAGLPPGTGVLGMPDGVACIHCDQSFAVADVVPTAAPSPPTLPAFVKTTPAVLLPTLESGAPNVPKTAQDVINAEVAAAADKSARTAAAVAANQAAKDATDVEAGTYADLAATLVKTGPVFSQDTAGRVEVYASDNNGGYHVTVPAQASTVVLPDPTPAPTPDPTPTPAS
jgi:hypothetical protein